MFYFLDIGRQQEVRLTVYRTVQVQYSFRRAPFYSATLRTYLRLYYSCSTPIYSAIPSEPHFRGPLIIKFAALSYRAHHTVPFWSHRHIHGPKCTRVTLPLSLPPLSIANVVDSRDQAFGSRKVVAANSGKTRPTGSTPRLPIVSYCNLGCCGCCPLNQHIYILPLLPLLSFIFCTVLSNLSIEY